MPYVGSRISLISKAEIRYEGILYVINTEESTIALQNVQSYGTEGRVKPDVPASEEVYDFIIFRGEDIKDLTVLEGSSVKKPSQRGVLEDPAVVSVGPERKITPGFSGRDNAPRREQPRAYPERREYENRQNSSTHQYNNNNNNNQYSQGQRGKGQYGKGGGQARPYEKKWDQPQRTGVPSGKGKGGQQSFRRHHDNSQSKSVGELAANENAQTKAEVGEEFDFSSVAQIEKPDEIESRAGYSKTKSFFDDISCDAVERAKGGMRFDNAARDKQREVDKETFGAAAASARPFHHGHRRYNGKGKGRAF